MPTLKVVPISYARRRHLAVRLNEYRLRSGRRTGIVDGQVEFHRISSDLEMDRLECARPDTRPQILVDLTRTGDSAYSEVLKRLFVINGDPTVYDQILALADAEACDIEITDAHAKHIFEMLRGSRSMACL